jgi:hypothetical protein
MMPAAAPARRSQLQLRRAQQQSIRFKRWYQRAKRGEAVAPVVYDHATVAVLIQLHYLPDRPVSAREVGAAITQAMRSLIDRMAD